MKPAFFRALPAILAAMLVAGCGGGSDSSRTTLSGTAATGAPVAGGIVSVTCSATSTFAAATGTATTAANGTYSVDLANAIFPCQVAVSGGSLATGVQLYGYTAGADTVNVTPLTTLIGAYATKAANGAPITQAVLDAAVAKVNDVLVAAGFGPLPPNALTTPFTPGKGDANDDYLESLMDALSQQNVTLGDLVTQITTTGAPAAPLQGPRASNAGSAQSTIIGKLFTLDGSANSGTPSYQWTLASKPATSAATLAAATTASPQFTPDVAGAYVFSLVVNDGKADSAPSTVTITVANAYDFSDNAASVSVVREGAGNVLQLETLQSASLASVNSFNTGIKGNRADLATDMLHGVKLSDFAGLSFKSRDDGTGYTGAGLPYVTYTISKQCDGAPAGWANLITNITDMAPSAPDADGYITYTADLSAGSTAWKSSNYNNPIYDATGTSVVLAANKTATGGSLTALITAYPNACIYNFPNPDAQVPNATNTPAVQILLGNSANLTAKKAWFKDIRIGNNVLF